jgi:hypothetical protein
MHVKRIACTVSLNDGFVILCMLEMEMRDASAL